MLKRALASLAFLATFSGLAFAQTPGNQFAAPATAGATPTPTPAFDLADVHASAKTTNPNFTGGSLRGDRFIVHNATMVDMLSLAYGFDGDNILSGPSWLDYDRYDISAHAPRDTSPDDVKRMLRALLAERFHLVVHPDTHPVPSYVLRVDKGGPRLKPADEGEVSHIEEHHTPTDLPPGIPAYYSVNFHNQTMAQFRQVY